VLKPEEVEGVFSKTDKYRQTEQNFAQKTSCVQLSLFLLSVVPVAYLAMLSV